MPAFQIFYFWAYLFVQDHYGKITDFRQKPAPPKLVPIARRLIDSGKVMRFSSFSGFIYADQKKTIAIGRHVRRDMTWTKLGLRPVDLFRSLWKTALNTGILAYFDEKAPREIGVQAPKSLGPEKNISTTPARTDFT